MDAQIIGKIKAIKDKYDPEGLRILGVFGSMARGDEKPDSDVDILYECTQVSFDKYPGWNFFAFYDLVKKDIEKELGRKVDLVDAAALNRVGKKYILPEVYYVT